MHLYLVHHADAVGSHVDPRRPLSPVGRLEADMHAAEAARLGARPELVWHSGKLRARQTAEAYWRACNPLAQFAATRDLQPGDPPQWMRDRLRGESRDVMVVGHFPHMPGLLAHCLGDADGLTASFPLHGIVALVSDDHGTAFRELWRVPF
jgi:phosphohistidine phosphatase